MFLGDILQLFSVHRCKEFFKSGVSFDSSCVLGENLNFFCLGLFPSLSFAREPSMLARHGGLRSRGMPNPTRNGNPLGLLVQGLLKRDSSFFFVGDLTFHLRISDYISLVPSSLVSRLLGFPLPKGQPCSTPDQCQLLFFFCLFFVCFLI